MNNEKLVETLNELIANAIIHGADAGGTYNQNEEGLTESINNTLSFFNLTEQYVVGGFDYKRKGEQGCWPILGIIKK